MDEWQKNCFDRITGFACWAAGQVFIGGYREGQAYNLGFQEAQEYNGGFQEGESTCG